MRRQVLGPRHADVAITLVELSRALADQGKRASRPSRCPARRSTSARRSSATITARRRPARATSGRSCMRRGDLAGAEVLLRENLATALKVLGPDHPNTGASMGNLASLLLAKGDPVSAEALARQGRGGRPRVSSASEHDEYASSLNTLGAGGGAAGSPRRSRADVRRVRADRPRPAPRRPSGDRHLPGEPRARADRARRRRPPPRPRSARRSASARRACRPTTGASDRRRACSRRRSSARGRVDEAESLMLAADRLLKPLPGGQARERDANRARLAALYRASGRPSRPSWRADPRPAGRRFLREPTPTKIFRRATSSSPRGSRSFT